MATLRAMTAAAWVQAGSTILLLLVTGYYAWKTKDMADSAKRSAEQSAKATAAAEATVRESAKAARAAEATVRENARAAEAAEATVRESARAAEAAERSAEAARDAARVAQSQIKPEFSGRLVAVKNIGTEGHTACLHIESTGDAVVVTGVRILRAFRRSTMRDGADHIDLEDEPLEPWGIDTVLPRRLHQRETVLVTHPELQEAGEDPLDYFILQVDYTFDERSGTGGTRQLKIDETPPAGG